MKLKILLSVIIYVIGKICGERKKKRMKRGEKEKIYKTWEKISSFIIFDC